MSYVVVGDRKVAGKVAGEILDDEDLVGVNVEALIVGGHIQKQKTRRGGDAGEQEQSS